MDEKYNLKTIPTNTKLYKTTEHNCDDIFDYMNLDRINHPKCIYWDEIDFSKSDNELKFIPTSFDD